MSTEKEFFKGKRPWSKLKDRVLGSYLPAYLCKVSKLGRRVVLIDCFAGPGKFDDGSPGSPLIMCQMAVKYAEDNCIAIFANKNQEHHEVLNDVLGKFIERGVAFPVLGDSEVLLSTLREILREDTVFMYLDPFGLKGCDFTMIKEMLTRDDSLSTEALINVSMPTVHRFACSNIVLRGRGEGKFVKKLQGVLTRTLGGDYWMDIMLTEELTTQEKELGIMEEYRRRLRGLLPFTGSCPVREKVGGRTKYFVTFCSRHVDTLLLMNDIMCRAYNDYMHEAALAEVPLLADATPDWRSQRDKEVSELGDVVRNLVEEQPGLTRKALWAEVVARHFMRFLGSEYKKVVQEMVESGDLHSPTERQTKRLNDMCVIFPGAGVTDSE